MAEARVYPKGIVAFPKSDKQPDFVKGAIIITVDELKKWIDGDGKPHQTDSKFGKQIKLQLTEYQGKLSLSVDTWKPTGQASVQRTSSPQTGHLPDPIDDSPLPF